MMNRFDEESEIDLLFLPDQLTPSFSILCQQWEKEVSEEIGSPGKGAVRGRPAVWLLCLFTGLSPTVFVHW
ncbi:hypothetical protein L1887_05286 [Cichorium endivia]|nr:hypothetical protein L1887_05286 [Cichorium endivia]